MKKRFHSFIEVDVKLPIEVVEANPVLAAHPLLPLRTEERIISPTGTWTGIYTSAELKLASELGYEINVKSGYMFNVDDTLFHRFISKFYNMRKEAKVNKNKALDQVSKLIMNSAYGRFALGTEPSLISITCSADELALIQYYFNTVETHRINESEYQVEVYLGLDEQSLERIDQTDGDDLEDRGEQFSQTSQDYRMRIAQAGKDAKAEDFNVERNIAIASIITSYARCLLYTYLIANPATVYMDTDSVMAARDLDKEDISSTQLGKMKLENNIKEGRFAAPKLYSYINDKDETTFKGKGIDRGSRSNLGVDDIRACVDDQTPIESTSIQWRRNQQEHTITTTEVTKKFSGANLKRVSVLDDYSLKVIAFLPLNVQPESDGGDGIILTEAKRVLESDVRKDPEFSRLLDVYNSIFKGAGVDSESQIRSAGEFAKWYTPKTFDQDEVMFLEPFNFDSMLDSDFMYSPKGVMPSLSEELKDKFDELRFNMTFLQTGTMRAFLERNAKQVADGEDVVDYNTMAKEVRSSYNRYLRYLSGINFLRNNIDVGEIPDYEDGRVLGIHDEFENIYAGLNSDTVNETLSTGRTPIASATIGTLENLRGFYYDVEARIAKVSDNPSEIEQIGFEQWCLNNHELVGNTGLKLDVFVTACYYAHSPDLHEKLVEYFNDIRNLILTREDERSLPIAAITSFIERADGDNQMESAMFRILARVFGITSKDGIEARAERGVYLSEALTSFLSGSSIALPMLISPSDYMMVGVDDQKIEDDVSCTSPYQIINARPIHASFNQLDSQITNSCQNSMNKAGSTGLVVAPHAGWVGNPTAIKYEAVEMGNISRLEQVQNIHSLLRAYKGREFFCPTFLDYRGRMYYYGSFLQPQTINFTRAHIESSQQAAVPDHSLAYLALFCMTETGGGGSHQGKLQGFMDLCMIASQMRSAFPSTGDAINFEYVQVIFEHARDMQFDMSAFWSILQCVELVSRIGSEEQTNSGLFIYSDAAQSGSQIISMFSNDKELGKAVNLGLDQDLGTYPTDYYASVVDHIRDNWESILAEKRDRMRLLYNAFTRTRGEEIQDSEVREIVNRITRKFVKRNVMTIAYNLTLYGAVGQLVEDLGTEITTREAAILAVLIRVAVEAKFPSLKSFIDICKESVNMKLANGELPMIETTMISTIVNICKTKKIELNGEEIIVETSTPSKTRLKSAHAPNVIHAFDATIVHYTQILASAIYIDGNQMPLITIHDSFATTPQFIHYLPIIQRLATVIALGAAKDSDMTAAMLPAAPEGYYEAIGEDTLEFYTNTLTSPYNYDLPILTDAEEEGIYNALKPVTIDGRGGEMNDNDLNAVFDAIYESTSETAEERSPKVIAKVNKAIDIILSNKISDSYVEAQLEYIKNILTEKPPDPPPA